MHEAAGKRPQTAGSAAQHALIPAVDHSAAAKAQVDLRFEDLAPEHAGHVAITVLEDARTERVDAHARLQRLPQIVVAVEIEPFSQLHQEVDDCGDRQIERWTGRRARPDHGVEVERRGEEARAEIARSVLDLAVDLHVSL